MTSDIKKALNLNLLLKEFRSVPLQQLHGSQHANLSAGPRCFSASESTKDHGIGLSPLSEMMIHCVITSRGG